MADNSKNKRKMEGGTILISIGAACLFAAFTLFLYNIWDDGRAGREADEVLGVLKARIEENRAEEIARRKGAKASEAYDTDGTDAADMTVSEADGSYGRSGTVGSQAEYELFPDMEMPTEDISGIRYIGEIYCPKIDRGSPIISSWSMELLKIAPCRYSGSLYGHDLVIASHNYTSHLGRMLRLRSGDDVYFTDVNGNEFHYKVIDREELSPSNVRDMIVKKDEADWDLTVFTCTMSGQTRMAIRCELVDSTPA